MLETLVMMLRREQGILVKVLLMELQLLLVPLFLLEKLLLVEQER